MRVRDFKEILDHIKSLVNAPVVNMMLIIGFLLLVLSFSEFDGIRGFSLRGSPNNWAIFIVGLLLLLGGPGIFVLTREDRRIEKKITIQKGISFSFNQLSVNLIVGKIEELPQLSRDSAVVLPADSSFIDDITDPKSALGAFFLKHYGQRIPKIRQDLEIQLQIQGYQKDSKGLYPLGTTVILPEDYDMPAKCLVTASTHREELIGISAEPSSVCECVRQVFIRTSDKKIERVYMPVLGSGHGGLDINDALLFLILSIKYYSKKFHHIKRIEVIVHPRDLPKLKDVWKLQYIMQLETRQK